MIIAAEYTNQGGREINEDSCGVIIQDHRACAVVADGLGGHGGGDVASSTAVDVVCESWRKTAEVDRDKLDSWFQEINEKIYEMQTDTCAMKTTLAVMTCEKGKAILAHVGDTRIYHFVDGKLYTVTFDHSVSQMAVLAGEISQEQIRHHVDRNKLLRAVGRDDEVQVEISNPMDITQNTHAFLLCTDGFWEYVLEQEMEELLAQASHPDEWIAGMVELLQSRVPEGNDNNTAIAVWMIDEVDTE